MQIFDTHGMGSYRSDRIHRRQYIRIPYRVCGRVLRPLLESIRKDLKAYRMDVGHVSRHLVWL